MQCLRPSSRRSERYQRVKAQWLETAEITRDLEDDFNNWFLGHDQPDLRSNVSTECKETVDSLGHVRRTWVTSLAAAQDSNLSSPVVVSSGAENSITGGPTGMASGSENGGGSVRIGTGNDS